MTQPAQITRATRSLPGFMPAIVGAKRKTLVVAADPLVAEALAVALSSCGITARAATALPWHGSPERRDGGTALVVLGGLAPDAARRTVAGLVGVGRRVAVVAGTDRGAALTNCVAAGAEAVITGFGTLSEVATLLDELGREGPVRSPDRIDVGRLREGDLSSDAQSRSARLGRLTNREREILTALMAGRRAARIAGDHFVSLHTVRTQIRLLLRKLEVNSQIEAVAVAHRAGWLPDTTRH